MYKHFSFHTYLIFENLQNSSQVFLLLTKTSKHYIYTQSFLIDILSTYSDNILYLE